MILFWKMIRANLAEAYGEICNLCRRLRYLEKGAEPGASGFDSVIEERWRDYREWQRFPIDWPELWPPASSC